MKSFKTTSILSLSLAAAVLALPGTASSQLIYSQDFDVNDAANWATHTLGTGSDANFFFDYSTIGIPSAPNSVGGTTVGLRLRANQNGSTATFPGGVSVSPIGQSFAGDYELRFDMWLNFNGPAPGGGNGSTQVGGAGIGTAGASAQIAGGVIDSVNFGASGEGGSSIDYRAYAPAAPTGYAPASGVFAAGTGTSPDARNNTHPYYSGFGGESAPAAQVALFPQQTGTTATGTLGWAWRDVQIIKEGDFVTWLVDGLLIATVDLNVAGTLGGGNILFQQYDINSTVSSEAASQDLLVALFDNVRVTQIPEPATGILALAGGFGLYLVSRRRRQP